MPKRGYIPSKVTHIENDNYFIRTDSKHFINSYKIVYTENFINHI